MFCTSIDVGVFFVAVVNVLRLATSTDDDVVVNFILINGIDAICAATAAVDSFIDCVDAGVGFVA
jgi:hypothetical protein